MGWLQSVMIFYGLFNIALGFLGYMNKGSIVSLAAGGVAGILVIGCAALSKTNPRVGFIAATVIALALIARFAQKAFGGEIYPAMVMVVVSALFALTLIGAHFAAMSKRKTQSIDPKA